MCPKIQAERTYQAIEARLLANIQHYIILPPPHRNKLNNAPSNPSLSSPLNSRLPDPLNLAPLDRVPAGGLEQAREGVGVPGLGGLLGGAHAHPALLVHGHRLARLEARALGYERRRQPRVACLQDEVVERLWEGGGG